VAELVAELRKQGQGQQSFNSAKVQLRRGPAHPILRSSVMKGQAQPSLRLSVMKVSAR
jgi:hypothetical protein